MEPSKYAAIAHADLDVLSPISLEKIDRVIELLELPPTARVLDLGCGKGEVLIRILERYGCEGMGVEPVPSFVVAARAEAAGRLQPGQASFREREAWEMEFDNESFDLVIVMDEHPWGDYRETLSRAWAMVRSGGQVLIGVRYWKQPPDPDYLDFLGCGEHHYESHADTVALAVKEPFTPLYVCTSCQDELDHHEGLCMRAVERFLRANPTDRHHHAFRERIHKLRDAYLRWGRDSVGFGLYLYLK